MLVNKSNLKIMKYPRVLTFFYSELGPETALQQAYTQVWA